MKKEGGRGSEKCQSAQCRQCARDENTVPKKILMFVSLLNIGKRLHDRPRILPKLRAIERINLSLD